MNVLSKSVAVLISGLSGLTVHNALAAHHVSANSVVENFAVIASAMLDDSVSTAETLQQDINAFLSNPNEETLAKAKQSYKLARVPYQQAEILRFDAENGNISEGLDSDGGPASVDDWEGQLNAWPLDEALIDYVDAQNYEGEYAEAANIINTSDTLVIGSESFDVSNITPELLISLNEVGGSEANVATGIHAVEFLLWGQDLNGTGPGAGQRPATDYITEGEGCTSGEVTHDDNQICQRRSDYLATAMQLYLDDLKTMAAEWSEAGRSSEGTLGYDFLNNGKGLSRIVDSVGDMAAGELASERMKVAILFGSTEDEHDCFSDNTHVAIFNNAQGIINAYYGSYTTMAGEEISGASLHQLIEENDAELDAELVTALDDVATKMQAIVDLAEDENEPVKFDQIVGGTVEQKQLVLDASESLLAFADTLGDNINSVLSIETQNFDKGTCPGDKVEECAE